MKKILPIVLAVLMLFCGCSQYAEPDVSELMQQIVSEQSFTSPYECTANEFEMIFDIDPKDLEAFKAVFSMKGACADMAVIVKANDPKEAEEISEKLSEYKDQRYEDFKGYAPLEAEKIENGRVLVYDSYVLLLTVSDISSAVQTADAAFKA